MSAGGKGVWEEEGPCGHYVQLRTSVNTSCIFCCADAIIPEFMGCLVADERGQQILCLRRVPCVSRVL